MQITVTIPDEFAAQVQERGLTPERYVEGLIAKQADSTSQRTDTADRLADLELFFQEMTTHVEGVPVLPDEALTRESFYQDHD